MADRPIILSRIDKQVNKIRKGKSRAIEHDKAFRESRDIDTPADGVSEIEPDHLPADDNQRRAMRRVQYDLPDDVQMHDCAIFYIGGESLALTNLLVTFSKNQVRTFISA